MRDEYGYLNPNEERYFHTALDIGDIGFNKGVMKVHFRESH